MSQSDSRVLLQLIRQNKDKMNLRSLLKYLVFSLLIGAFIAMLLEGIAIFVPIYEIHIFSLCALFIALITGMVFSCFHKSSMKESALYMDSFGFQEQIITAYENLEQEEPILVSQREIAIRNLQNHQDRIQYSMLPSYKQMILVSLFLVFTLIFALIPSPAKDQAVTQHQVKTEVKEKKEEIKEAMKNLEELDPSELTAEQQQLLQDMLSSLSSSYSDFNSASSSQDVNAAMDRLNFKMDQLSMMPNSEFLQQALGDTTLGSNMNNQMASNNPQADPNSQAGQSASGSSGEGNGQSDSNGQNGQGSQSGDGDQSGQGGDGQGSQDGQGSNQNDQSQSGQGSQGQGQGQGGQDGQGNGQGQGQNSGSGQGQGGGQGGSGRGEGTTSATHDYVSVPNAVGDQDQLHGIQNGQNGNQFLAQNGLNWEGNHVPYQEVIGNYTSQAYEGISRGQYPTGMENVIRDYFSNLN